MLNNYNISSNIHFHGAGLKVKVTVAVFRKKNVMALVPTFIAEF